MLSRAIKLFDDINYKKVDEIASHVVENDVKSNLLFIDDEIYLCTFKIETLSSSEEAIFINFVAVKKNFLRWEKDQ